MPVNNLTNEKPWSLKETVAPAEEPITTAEAKLHLRVDHGDEDAYIDKKVKQARQHFEEITRRALVNTTFELKLDAFPTEIRPPRSPLSSVSSITYVDTNGDTQTLSASVYSVDTDTEPGRISLAFNQSWPDIREQNNAVVVTFVAGYGAAATDVPAALVQPVEILMAHFYELRVPVVVGTIATKIPMHIESLIWIHRVLEAP